MSPWVGFPKPQCVVMEETGGFCAGSFIIFLIFPLHLVFVVAQILFMVWHASFL